MARLHDPDGLLDHLQGWADFEDYDSNGDAEVDDFADEPYQSFDSFEDEYLPENDTTVRNEGVKIGRNDTCPCGSGKKYKKCEPNSHFVECFWHAFYVSRIRWRM